MGPAATFASGLFVGLTLFLAMALMGVIAVNGTNNPGITSAQASAAAGGTAELPPNGRRDPSSLRSLDLNGDGKLSLAEAAGYAEIVTKFDRADRNKDGKLTQAEFDRLAKLPEPKAAKKKGVSKQPRRPSATASS
jgi:hypothetical protein